MLKFIILFSVIVTFVLAKCGITYSDTHNMFCNDLEMLEQCNRAQTLIDNYVNKIHEYLLNHSNNPELYALFDYSRRPELACANSISCYYDFKNTTDNFIFCENTDLYIKCTQASTVLDNYMKTIDRRISDVLPVGIRFGKPNFYCFSALGYGHSSTTTIDVVGYSFNNDIPVKQSTTSIIKISELDSLFNDNIPWYKDLYLRLKKTIMEYEYHFKKLIY